jgi:CIC family chloride channel protein
MKRISAKLIVMVIVVGLGAGLGAVFFRWLIGAMHDVFFGTIAAHLGALGGWRVVVPPALGGALVGPIVYYLAREAKGHGVPEVMYAVGLGGGRIRPRVSVVKAIASSICIGSGGSAGREGPIVQIGSSLGSSLGQLLKEPERVVKLLVACGAAGGIAATFNAPIAGVIFALEIILGEFSAQNFGYVVLASVTASVVSRSAMGNYPAFKVPTYTLVTYSELALYVLLGVICAAVGLFYSKLVYWSEDLFERLQVNESWTPILGGALVGLIGIKLPQIFGVGYDSIESALNGEFILTTLALLAAAKIVATSLTLGSGGSGGIFAPALFIGAMTGGAFGKLAGAAFPGIGPPGAYGIVGMGAVFAASAHAPITSILILFEMTGDYRIILPLMAAVVIATIIAQRASKESIYTTKLLRRGIDLSARTDINLMANILVRDAMRTEPVVVSPETRLRDVYKTIRTGDQLGVLVAGDDGLLQGIITLTDLTEADLDSTERTARDVMTRDLITCAPDETLDEVLKKPGARDVARIPVVESPGSKKLVGLVRRSDMLDAYAGLAAEHAHLVQLMRAAQLRDAHSPRLLELAVQRSSPADGKTIAELGIPHGALLATVVCGTKEKIPSGETVLRAGDRVLVLSSLPDDSEVTRLFRRQRR